MFLSLEDISGRQRSIDIKIKQTLPNAEKLWVGEDIQKLKYHFHIFIRFLR